MVEFWCKRGPYQGNQTYGCNQCVWERSTDLQNLQVKCQCTLVLYCQREQKSWAANAACKHVQLSIYKREHCDFGGYLRTVGVIAFLYSKYDHPQKWNFDENDFSKERYLWTCWSHDFPAACTLGIMRNSHSTCEQSSPCRVTLGSCTVPALRSVWYKNTTSCSLWILAKHTGSHACSMLETRGGSQQDVCFYVWSQAQIVIEAHTSWASVHNLSNATKCNAGAPTSQATCSISHKKWSIRM